MTTSVLFRPAAPASTQHYVRKTLLQCAVIWSLFLVVFPLLIASIEWRVGLPAFSFPGQSSVALTLLLGFSALNLLSGGLLAREGRGTPLPLDCPSRLVLTGPYAYVRNPMAIAGLGQGLAVVLWLGSWLGLVYVLLGAMTWQFGARPAEERDLRERFGATYEEYARTVRCWWPRLRPFHGTEGKDAAAAMT
jgi:protein-S-isoprenylcysteine O-methyltransferase Ste14